MNTPESNTLDEPVPWTLANSCQNPFVSSSAGSQPRTTISQPDPHPPEPVFVEFIVSIGLLVLAHLPTFSTLYGAFAAPRPDPLVTQWLIHN